jgi:hypothetical protein
LFCYRRKKRRAKPRKTRILIIANIVLIQDIINKADWELGKPKIAN